MRAEEIRREQRIPDFVDMRLIPVASVVWVVSWWGTGSSVNGSDSLLAVVGFGLLGALLMLWRRGEDKARPHPRHRLIPAGSLRFTAAVTCIAAAAALLISQHARTTFEEDPFHDTLASQHTLECEVEVTGYPHSHSGGSSLWGKVMTLPARTLYIHHTDGRAEATSVDIRIRGKGMAALQRGDRLRVRIKASERQRLGPPTAAEVTLMRLISRTPAQGLASIPAQIRAHTHVILHEASPHTRGLIPGLAMGDRSALPARLTEAMRVASLSHLSAISGTHIAVVLGALILVVPGRGVLRVCAVALTTCGIVLLAGPTPSVLRSLSMMSVGLWGLIARRPGQAIAALATATIGLLYWDPWNARSFAFALSVLATAGVVTSAQRWHNWAKRHIRADTVAGKTLRILHGMIAVPLAAQLWVMPVIILMNPHLPLWGVGANVVVAPVVPPLTILAMGVCLSAPLWPSGAEWLLCLAEPLAAWINEVALGVAALPGAQVPWMEGIDGALLWLALLFGMRAGIKFLARMGHWTARSELFEHNALR